jgi:TonB-linked SusC/RagA family outer membrane protein
MNEGANIQGRADGFPYESLNVFSQALEDGKILSGGEPDPFRQESYLGRIIYDYNNKILFTGSFRRDGVSRFGPENRWGNFPSASLAYKVNEDFLQNVEQINMLKLRVGWGQTGNSDIGEFLYEDFLTPPTQFSPVFGDPNQMVTGTYVFYSFSNPLIRWESAQMTNIGMDINAFNNKIQATLEYYWKTNEDLLVQVPVSIVFGRSGDGSEPFTNLGEVSNKGFEMNLMYKNYDGEFKYSTSVNLTTFSNEVVFIPEDRDIAGNNTRTREGHTIGSLFGYVAEGLVTPDDFDENDNYLHAVPAEGVPEPGDIRFRDLNNDGKITDLDRTIIGKSLPDLIGGFNFEASWKNFDFSLFLNGMFKYDIFHQQRASLSSFVNQDINHNKLREWTENAYTVDNPSSEYVRADPNNTNDNNRISTWWIEDGTFVRVRDVQLGYSLPATILSNVGINRARLYVSATNPFLFTGYSGRDPENSGSSNPLNAGTDNGGYPNPRVYTFGMQIEF